MRVTGINANLPVADVAAARDFYTDYLGLNVEEFNLGWVARYSSPSGGACVQRNRPHLRPSGIGMPRRSVLPRWHGPMFQLGQVTRGAPRRNRWVPRGGVG